MKPIVHISHADTIGESPAEFTDKSVELIRALLAEAFDSFDIKGLLQGESVLIKPNFFKHTDYPVGAISRLDTIRACVDYARDTGCEAWVGEAGLNRQITDLAFMNSGLSDYCEREGVKLMNFFEGEAVKVDCGDFEVNIAEPITQADHVISLCKLKSHSIHGVTLSGKNLMGCVIKQRRVYFHSGKALATLIEALTDRFSIYGLIDGVIGMAYCEGSGVPMESGVVLAGNEPITLDAFGAEMMGYDLRDIPIFKYLRPQEYDTVGDEPPKLEFIKPIGWGS